MADIQIRREDTESKGRYVATVEGTAGEGELTFSKASDVLVIVDHTGVPDSMRGMGIAAALAQRMIHDARAKGQKIMPLCPFMRTYMDRHKDDTADLRN